MTIYHIATEAEWAAAKRKGEYAADSLSSEGFIHCSTAAQVASTANAIFRGRRDLVLLHIDDTRVGATIKYEGAEGGERFPHIYGPLPVGAVVAEQAFLPERDGRFTFGAD